MISELKPYPAMKDSGVKWLGEVPEHWEVVPLTAVGRPKSIAGLDGRELLSVYLDRGVIRFSDVQEKRTNVTSKDLSKYQAVDPGDFVLNNQQAWRGSVGVSRLTGIVSPAYLVLALSDKLNTEYANLLFRERAMVSQYLIASKGVGSIQRNLYWPHLKRVATLVPPLPEQAAIVRYLDHVDRRVRRLVRAKRKLIALLTEQKQAIIHRAVTRGLDPDVPLKDSGVEWLGEVPEHWEVRKLKFTTKMIAGGATPASGQGEFWDGEVVWVTPQDVSKNDRLFSSIRKLTAVGAASCSTVMVPPKSVIVTSRAPVGNVSMAEVEFCTNQGCKAVIPDDQYMLNEYCFVLLRFMQPVFQRAANGTTFLEISTWAFENIKVPLPSIDEQREILEHIWEKSAEIDEAISRAAREIELLNEYRTRLIADVVTGKLDVRDAAAALPEVDPLAEADNGDNLDADLDPDADELDETPEETEA